MLRDPKRHLAAGGSDGSGGSDRRHGRGGSDDWGGSTGNDTSRVHVYRASNAAESVEALGSGIRESTAGALDGALARAISRDGALAHDDAASNGGAVANGDGSGGADNAVGAGGGVDGARSSSGGSGRLGGVNGLRSSRGSSGGSGSRASSAGDGSSGKVTSALGDGVGLELGMGLLGSGVDGEGHAAAAVVALSAEHPERVGGHDLHGDLGRRNDGVVRVGHIARVHAAGKRVARGLETRLGNGVVLAVEGEDDHVTNVGGDLLGEERETLGTTDIDGVGGASAGNNTASTGLDGGRGTVVAEDGGGGSAGGNGHGLGDGDLLVESGRGNTTTLADPDNDGVDTADGTEANAAETTETTKTANTDAANGTDGDANAYIGNTANTTNTTDAINADLGIPLDLPAAASRDGDGSKNK